MLNSGGNQAMELSSRNSYRYAIMDNRYDNDEIGFCQSETDRSSASPKTISCTKRVKVIVFIVPLICLTFLITAIIGVILTYEKPVDYKNHKVLKLFPATVEDLNHIIGLEKEYEVNFWNEPYFKDPTEPILIQISPGDEETRVTVELNKMNLNYTVFIEDLEFAIKAERTEHMKHENETEFNFSRYHTYEEILQYLETELSNHSLLKTYSIGKSFEGRQIPVIRITSQSDNDLKPVILIDSLIHAKEWVTCATNLYIINQLIGNQSLDKYLEKFEFHIIPILNPDGYAYTWRTDRLWRKTRSFSIRTVFCRGADANRNFNISFCSDSEDHKPCSDNYCGDYAFSEPEIIAFKNYALKLNETKQIKAYFSLHSYQQKVLYPFAYKFDSPHNLNQLLNLSERAANAIKQTHGIDYRTGSASDIMYTASGVSIDWMYEKMNVDLSFAFELRDRGHYGHLLPKQYILPTAQEVWEGIKAILDSI